jgi:nitrogen fixation NifU-like protein
MAVDESMFNDVVMDYYVAPSNKRDCECPSGTSRGSVPGCADDVVVSVRLGDGNLDDRDLDDVCWNGTACMAGTASASIMTEALTGVSSDEAHETVQRIRGFMKDRSASINAEGVLAEMQVLGGYRSNPVRVKCVLLPWEALDEALTLAETKHATPARR